MKAAPATMLRMLVWIVLLAAFVAYFRYCVVSQRSTGLAGESPSPVRYHDPLLPPTTRRQPVAHVATNDPALAGFALESEKVQDTLPGWQTSVLDGAFGIMFSNVGFGVTPPSGKVFYDASEYPRGYRPKLEGFSFHPITQQALDRGAGIDWKRDIFVHLSGWNLHTNSLGKNPLWGTNLTAGGFVMHPRGSLAGISIGWDISFQIVKLPDGYRPVITMAVDP